MLSMTFQPGAFNFSPNARAAAISWDTFGPTVPTASNSGAWSRMALAYAALAVVVLNLAPITEASALAPALLMRSTTILPRGLVTPPRDALAKSNTNSFALPLALSDKSE